MRGIRRDREHEGALPPLLESWINPNRTIALSDTPDWARLEKACSGNNLFPAIAAQLRGRTIQSAIHHGDLAPWNIKVSPAGAWTVLDWERGELTGIPGWDWFHYVIQSAILVGHLPTLRPGSAGREFAELSRVPAICGARGHRRLRA